MSHYIAVFKSLTHTHAFCQALKNCGINACVEETPREALVSCGLCVRFSDGGFGKAKNIFSNGGYSTFVGIFKVEKRADGRTSVLRVF